MRSSPKVLAHLEAALGWGRVPTVEQFASQDSETVSKLLELFAYVEEVTAILKKVTENRPRQEDLPGIEPPAKPQRRRKAE